MEKVQRAAEYRRAIEQQVEEKRKRKLEEDLRTKLEEEVRNPTFRHWPVRTLY